MFNISKVFNIIYQSSLLMIFEKLNIDDYRREFRKDQIDFKG